MKKVVISGSCKLHDKVDYWVNHFKSHGYEVLAYPNEYADCDLDNTYKFFYQNIDNADILFIMNEDKDDTKGYIGPSTFAELVYAVMQKVNHNKDIDIYLLQEPSNFVNCYDVVRTFLNHDRIKIYKNPSLSKQLTSYAPFNEQEENDKKMILEYISLHSKIYSSPLSILLYRGNTLAHFSSSALVVNKTKDKILVVNHNILGGWIYPGGHADGEEYLLSVAIREVEEETGIKAGPLDDDIFGIQTVPIPGHTKEGKYVSPHIHFDVIYLLEADDTLPLTSKPDENTGVKWISLDESIYEVLADPMKPIFSKLIAKLQNFK